MRASGMRIEVVTLSAEARQSMMATTAKKAVASIILLW